MTSRRKCIKSNYYHSCQQAKKVAHKSKPYDPITQFLQSAAAKAVNTQYFATNASEINALLLRLNVQSKPSKKAFNAIQKNGYSKSQRAYQNIIGKIKCNTWSKEVRLLRKARDFPRAEAAIGCEIIYYEDNTVHTGFITNFDGKDHEITLDNKRIIKVPLKTSFDKKQLQIVSGRYTIDNLVYPEEYLKLYIRNNTKRADAFIPTKYNDHDRKHNDNKDPLQYRSTKHGKKIDWILNRKYAYCKRGDGYWRIVPGMCYEMVDGSLVCVSNIVSFRNTQMVKYFKILKFDEIQQRLTDNNGKLQWIGTNDKDELINQLLDREDRDKLVIFKMGMEIERKIELFEIKRMIEIRSVTSETTQQILASKEGVWFLYAARTGGLIDGKLQVIDWKKRKIEMLINRSGLKAKWLQVNNYVHVIRLWVDATAFFQFHGQSLSMSSIFI